MHNNVSVLIEFHLQPRDSQEIGLPKPHHALRPERRWHVKAILARVIGVPSAHPPVTKGFPRKTHQSRVLHPSVTLDD